MDEVLTESYAIWAGVGTGESSVGKQLDTILADCIYYPEEEWSTFNFRPPENADLLAAWRDVRGHVFVFLLGRAAAKNNPHSPDYRVLIAGGPDLVRAIGRQITSHKGTLAKIEKRELAERRAGENFNEELKTKSVERLAGVVAVFTVIVNAFSLYLRSLPLPDLQDELFLKVYRWLIALVHVGALILLLFIIILAFAYLLKFGILLLRRRK